PVPDSAEWAFSGVSAELPPERAEDEIFLTMGNSEGHPASPGQRCPGSLAREVVGHQFGSRPTAAARARLPLVRADRVGRVQQPALSVCQFFEEAIEPRHGIL